MADIYFNETRNTLDVGFWIWSFVYYVGIAIP